MNTQTTNKTETIEAIEVLVDYGTRPGETDTILWQFPTLKVECYGKFTNGKFVPLGLMHTIRKRWSKPTGNIATTSRREIEDLSKYHGQP